MVTDESRLLAKVATLYYRSQLSQQDIATRLGLSRQSVGRLLQRARDQGIVRIEIGSPISYDTELECTLEETFGLLEAVVVRPHTDSEASVKIAIGSAAAEFLGRRLQDGDIVGIASGSTTVYECALNLKPTRASHLRVVGLNGSVNRENHMVFSENVIHLAARLLNAKPIVLTAPAFVDRSDIKASLLTDSSIAAVLELARQANIAIYGIGDFSPQSSPYLQGHLTSEMLHQIQASGGVGEIAGNGYDLQGNPCSSEISDRTIAIGLDHLRSKTLTVALAGGARKVHAIYGAIRGRYCNVLVTDEEAARALVHLYG